ncbi:MAG: PIG-L family deacetylase [Chloroflexi bacterium]|nr:PIG-L family deacetylase [Chloroflexota bacterium]
MRVLVLAAHTDDEVLGVGGTIAKHSAAGDQVCVCIACNRATNHTYDQAVIQRLRGFARKASEQLGVKELIFCDGLDERLTVIDAVQLIEGHVARIRPDVVYTHHRGDSNQDHQVLFKASVIVTRTSGAHVVRKVLCYEVPSSTEQGPPFGDYAFVPNVFVNIEETLEQKIKALMAYETEIGPFPHPRSLESIRIAAQRWGVKSGLKAAEAFELVRDIVY